MSYPRGSQPYAPKGTGEGGGSNVIITPPDKTLIIITIFLVVIGIMAVFSAGSPRAISMGENPILFTLKQIAWLGAGIAGCVYFSKTDYRNLRYYSMIFCCIVLVLLALVQFSPLGVTVNEAKRWLVLGIQFQPSELAKPALVLALASMFSYNTKLLDERKIPYYIIFVLSLFLIYKQPNLSMVVLLLSTFLAMYFMAGGKVKNILLMVVPALPLVAFKMKDYQLQRIMVWLDPEKDPYNAGYNIIQSLVAFADGNFFGVGFGNSKQKLSWLPEGHTDFIFAVIAEEFGFLGCAFIVGLFMMFVQRGFVIASRAPDMFGKLVAVGITFSITFQAFMNMAVASSFVPATGIPLPFISYGGSSLFVTLCMLGVLLSISRKRVQRITPRGGFYAT